MFHKLFIPSSYLISVLLERPRSSVGPSMLPTPSVNSLASSLRVILHISQECLTIVFKHFFVALLLLLMKTQAEPVIGTLYFTLNLFTLCFKFFIHGDPINQEWLLFRGPWKKT